MKKKTKVIIVMLIIVLLGITFFAFMKGEDNELKSVKSAKKLEKIYEGEDNDAKETLIRIVGMPFSIFDMMDSMSRGTISSNSTPDYSYSGVESFDIKADATQSSSSTSVKKDYSTTNIQVENVDEADITKTDGDYIYSISNADVIITDVKDPKNIKIASKITGDLGSVPEDLILYKNQLIVISMNDENSTSRYNSDTNVRVYDITQRESPILVKKYELYEPYYTSRRIDNHLFVIASGDLRKEDDKVVSYYEEDGTQKEIGYDNIKYLKDVNTRKQTLISLVDLDDVKSDVKVDSYLMDISNAYVSENAIYLLNYSYSNSYAPPLKSLYGLKGVIGPFTYEEDDDESGYYTEIYKFDITKNGEIKYRAKTKAKGETINQYSLDEYNNHLRIALSSYSDGTKIMIFDEELNKIGETESIEKRENMYSSRFIGNKAYIVTYQTIDPLIVVDLSNEENPRVLGELKIPGYSTYLHPYDENHLIGIGMETEETVNRNFQGKVTGTSARTVGMKMALFDVSNVNNPIQISSTVIGDARTTSAILTNPKALLFSKERNLIAIPVNNYAEDFEIDDEGTSYQTIINSYMNYSKDYIGEGYLVYDINLEDGFKLKGVVTHEKDEKYISSYYYGRYVDSKLLRGLYIEDNLYTISETMIKVNNLKDLKLVDMLKFE